MKEPKGKYSDAKEVFADYWRSYGGLHALLRSPYLHLAVLITILFAPAWLGREWWTSVIQVLPNIVGFSIGGYAIWLGFGDEKFKALISGQQGVSEISPYMEVSATFCHFIVVQLLAIIFALGAMAFDFDGGSLLPLRKVAGVVGLTWGDVAPVLRSIGGFIGFFLFMYALLTALAAVFAIFEVARWFEAYRSASSVLGVRPASADATCQPTGKPPADARSDQPPESTKNSVTT